MRDAFSTAEQQLSPLALDLDGDGVETTTDENGNQHKQTGTFIKTDGTTGSAIETLSSQIDKQTGTFSFVDYK